MQLNGSSFNGASVNGSGQILRALSHSVTYTSSSSAATRRTAGISRFAIASGAAALLSLAARVMSFSAVSAAVSAINQAKIFALLFSCNAVSAVSVSRAFLMHWLVAANANYSMLRRVGLGKLVSVGAAAGVSRRFSLVRQIVANGVSAFSRMMAMAKTSLCTTSLMLLRVVGIYKASSSGASTQAWRDLIRVTISTATCGAQLYTLRKMIFIGTANVVSAISKLFFVSASCRAVCFATSISAAFLQRTREQFMSAYVLVAAFRQRVVVAAERIRRVVGEK